jgi:hypothetical protein
MLGVLKLKSWPVDARCIDKFLDLHLMMLWCCSRDDG